MSAKRPNTTQQEAISVIMFILDRTEARIHQLPFRYRDAGNGNLFLFNWGKCQGRRDVHPNKGSNKLASVLQPGGSPKNCPRKKRHAEKVRRPMSQRVEVRRNISSATGIGNNGIKRRSDSCEKRIQE